MIENINYKLLQKLAWRLFGRTCAIGLGEYVFATFPSLAREYCLTFQGFLENEREHLRRYDMSSFKRLTFVGGGAVPFTAIYWAKYFDGPINVLDKDATALSLGRRLVHKLDIKNIFFIGEWGQAYDGYQDSVIIVTLYAENRDDILRKILEDGNARKLLILRSFENQPPDSFDLPWTTIDHGLDFFTLVALIEEGDTP
jgi:hypothetical protein